MLRKKVHTLNRKRYNLEDRIDDEIAEKIQLAQQATEGSAKTKKLFGIDFLVT